MTDKTKMTALRIGLPTCLIFAGLFVSARYLHRPALAALLAPAWITILVLRAMSEMEVSDDDERLSKILPTLDEKERNTADSWRLYEKATQMHIDTDKGMYQLIAVFVPASLLVLGLAVPGSAPSSIPPDYVVIEGSLSIVLVGLATLLKHRLRHYNKLREIYLRRLEVQLTGADSRAGLHTFIQAATRLTFGRAPSFHEAIDIYYFIYVFVWIALYVWKISGGSSHGAA